MENDEKMMTGEESLRIITDMINKTKVSIRQGSFHLLFWGWLLIICSLAAWLLAKYSDYPHPYYVWFLVIPGTFVSMIYGFVNGRKEKVRTYANKLYMWTWIGFLIAATVLFIIQAKNMDNVTPYILLLAGFPTFLSGFILRFKPLIIGGVCFWVVALLVNFAGPELAPLGTPVAMLIGYLIPGYMLKNRVNHDKI
jgi:uncharacterized membrane protein